MIETIISWLINFIFISVVIASADAKRGYRLDEHPNLTVFLAFIIPTVLEIISLSLYGKPFLWLIFS